MTARSLAEGRHEAGRSLATSHEASAKSWDGVEDRVRARGLRWTPQRATLVEVLAAEKGHVTGSQLVARCRDIEPATTPSTVYRTLGVLEELGLISHSHGLDGREVFHVLPATAHGHLICGACGADEELSASDAAVFLDTLRRDRGFVAEVDHLSVTGRCRACAAGPR
ncbi:MAG: Fur family transcriptional regulator [Chloroflexota bacterium]